MQCTRVPVWLHAGGRALSIGCSPEAGDPCTSLGDDSLVSNCAEEVSFTGELTIGSPTEDSLTAEDTILSLPEVEVKDTECSSKASLWVDDGVPITRRFTKALRSGALNKAPDAALLLKETVDSSQPPAVVYPRPLFRNQVMDTNTRARLGPLNAKKDRPSAVVAAARRAIDDFVHTALPSNTALDPVPMLSDPSLDFPSVTFECSGVLATKVNKTKKTGVFGTPPAPPKRVVQPIIYHNKRMKKNIVGSPTHSKTTGVASKRIVPSPREDTFSASQVASSGGASSAASSILSERVAGMSRPVASINSNSVGGSAGVLLERMPGMSRAVGTIASSYGSSTSGFVSGPSPSVFPPSSSSVFPRSLPGRQTEFSPSERRALRRENKLGRFTASEGPSSLVHPSGRVPHLRADSGVPTRSDVPAQSNVPARSDGNPSTTHQSKGKVPSRTHQSKGKVPSRTHQSKGKVPSRIHQSRGVCLGVREGTTGRTERPGVPSDGAVSPREGEGEGEGRHSVAKDPVQEAASQTMRELHMAIRQAAQDREDQQKKRKSRKELQREEATKRAARVKTTRARTQVEPAATASPPAAAGTATVLGPSPDDVSPMLDAPSLDDDPTVLDDELSFADSDPALPAPASSLTEEPGPPLDWSDDDPTLPLSAAAAPTRMSEPVPRPAPPPRADSAVASRDASAPPSFIPCLLCAFPLLCPPHADPNEVVDTHFRSGACAVVGA